MLHLLEQYEYESIRDVPDAREASNVHFDRLARLRRGDRKIALTGANGSAAGCPPGLINLPGGGMAQTHRGPACPTPACADIIGFNTLNVANFPVAGGGVGVVTNTPGIVVGSGNASAYKPAALFYEGRDNANALANVVCLLSDVQISGVQQLVDNANTAGITSAVFALTNEPLPVGWDEFTDRGQKQLTMIFSNVLAPAVTLEMFGVLWGSRIP